MYDSTGHVTKGEKTMITAREIAASISDLTYSELVVLRDLMLEHMLKIKKALTENISQKDVA